MNSVLYCLHNLSQKSHLRRMEKFIQHGDTSCLLHTIAVAYYSIKIAEFFGIKYKKRDLIRGALLHDYFLYDWHAGKLTLSIISIVTGAISLISATVNVPNAIPPIRQTRPFILPGQPV